VRRRGRYAIKHQRIAAALEAPGQDCGAVIFTVLGIARR
jgi:hypothetical protein